MKNIFKSKRIQIFLAVLIIFTLHTQVFTHLAFARESGGGELGEFETDKFLMNVGIGMASTFVGGAISEGINSSAAGANFFSGGTANGVAYGGFNGAISNAGNLGTWASNFNSMAALSQLGSGINMMGQQKGWDPSKTTMISSVVQGAVGGGLNSPAGASFTDFSKAATVGAISGATEGAILANNLGSDGSVKPWVSMTAGLAGSFVGGMTSSAISPVIPNKQTQAVKVGQTPSPSYEDFVKSGNSTISGPISEARYNQIAAYNSIKNNSGLAGVNFQIVVHPSAPKMVDVYANRTSYHKANNFGEAFTHGAVAAFSAIPSRAISVGVSRIASQMDNKQDAFMVRQAFTGIYSVAGAVYKHEVRDPAFNSLGLNHYTGSNGLAGTEFQKLSHSYEPVQIQTEPVRVEPMGEPVNININQW